MGQLAFVVVLAVLTVVCGSVLLVMMRRRQARSDSMRGSSRPEHHPATMGAARGGMGAQTFAGAAGVARADGLADAPAATALPSIGGEVTLGSVSGGGRRRDGGGSLGTGEAVGAEATDSNSSRFGANAQRSRPLASVVFDVEHGAGDADVEHKGGSLGSVEAALRQGRDESATAPPHIARPSRSTRGGAKGEPSLSGTASLSGTDAPRRPIDAFAVPVGMDEWGVDGPVLPSAVGLSSAAALPSASTPDAQSDDSVIKNSSRRAVASAAVLFAKICPSCAIRYRAHRVVCEQCEDTVLADLN